MTKTSRAPFRNLGIEAWQNLAMAGLVIIYLAQCIWSIAAEYPLASGIGLDFRAYWSGGYIANTAGYKDVYNAAVLTEVQKGVVPIANYLGPFEVAPVSILPIFLPVFQIFALLPPVPAFYIWSALNLAGLFLYLWFFFKKLKIPRGPRLAVMGLLAFPTFQNIFWGQIDLPLLICVGESIRYFLGKQEFRSGLWLGGLVLKPQLLILIGPALLFQRKWKLLGGFCVTILVALAGSFLLGGWSGFVGLFNTMTKFASGIPTNAPANMMNWRMIGERLSGFLPPYAAWAAVGTGMAVTAILAFLLWRKPDLPPADYLAAFTGTLAANLAVTWHSHVHMAMVLIPPLLVLFAQKALPVKLANWWLFGIPFLVLFLAIATKFLPASSPDTLPGLTGFCMLVFNLLFLAWAWKGINNPSKLSTKETSS